MNLADAYLKTARAKEHLDSLREELEIYYESKPCKFKEQTDIRNQRYRIRIHIVDPPDRLSLIAGDVFGCLRASLDHLVWALSSFNTTAYAENTQFPILEEPNAPRFKRQTNNVPAGAVAIIDSLQPYSRGKDRKAFEGHLLWRLNRLCNIDKHRRIPLHGSVVDFKLPASIPQSMVVCDSDTMSLPLQMKDAVRLHRDATFKVTFGDSHEGIECDQDGIERIYAFVAGDVIPRFAKFFK